MIGWLLRKIAPAPAPRPADTSRKAAPENCALWHDVTRALEAKPRGIGK